jgi:hypothetical protein
MLNRRDFIIKLVRNASLLSLAAISGYLIFGRNEEEVCDFSFVCRNCKKVKDCQLPEAENYKVKRANE